MLRIRLKMGPPRNKEWTCCFGLHVHTATIMIGIWHLFLNILALCLLAFMIRNPEMMHELDSNCDDCVDLNAPALPTPLSKIDPPYAYRDHSLNYRKSRDNIDMGGLVCVCMIAITLMMIYGAVKGKPSHLLPFFCLQLFDFALTTLTAAGYFCYLQSIHRLIAESHRLPYREKLLQLSPDALVMVVLIAFISIVFLKAYAIGIVWRCYKYLTMRQHNIRSMLPYIIPHVSSTNCLNGGTNGIGNNQERDYSTLLPDYDEAIAQNMKQQPPPSYQVAMSNIQVELPSVNHNENDNDNYDDNNTINATTTTTTSNSNNVEASNNSNNNSNSNNNDDNAATNANETILVSPTTTAATSTAKHSVDNIEPMNNSNQNGVAGGDGGGGVTSRIVLAHNSQHQSRNNNESSA